MIACTRCRIELAVDIDAVAGLDTPTGFSDCETWERTKDLPTSPPSGEVGPLVIPLPAGAMMDPDDADLLVHRACCTEDEIAEDEDAG